MEELSVNIGRVIDEILPEAIITALNDGLQDVENEAKNRCPVDDGALRGSIIHMVEQDGNSFIGSVGTNAEYAPYVHEGTGLYAKDKKGRQNVPWVYKTADGKFYSTKGHKPNPFLQEALDENMDNIMLKFEGALKDDT